MYMGTRFKLGAVAIAMAISSGCATPVSDSPEAGVRPRAQAWLDALMAFDIEGIYSFTSPGYQSAHSAEYYSRNYAGRNMWKTAGLGEVSCDGAEEFGVCKVRMVITFRGFMMQEDMTTELTETWVNIDGVWYTKPRL